MILELETGRVLADWRSQVGKGAMAWSADGQLLAVGGDGDDTRVFVWNVRRGALASVLQGHTGEIVGAQFAHSGYLLARRAGMARPGSGTRPRGSPSRWRPVQPRGVLAGRPPAGLRLGGKIGVWDVADGPECRTLHPAMLGNRSETRDVAR